MDKQSILKTNGAYWDTFGNDALGAISLPSYGAFVSEDGCRLLGDVQGKRVLEIGCGNGRSLEYMARRGAKELWGMDLSERQLERARRYLSGNGVPARLICSPMEEDCGIPLESFDLIYSIYAVGWTTDLQETFRRIAGYLKKGGVFVFSWSHPIHKCVGWDGEKLVFQKSYFDESWYAVPSDFCGGALRLSDRKVSSYVNALAQAGFVIERMVEETDQDRVERAEDVSGLARRAKRIPLTFVMKARKG